MGSSAVRGYARARTGTKTAGTMLRRRIPSPTVLGHLPGFFVFGRNSLGTAAQKAPATDHPSVSRIPGGRSRPLLKFHNPTPFCALAPNRGKMRPSICPQTRQKKPASCERSRTQLSPGSDRQAVLKNKTKNHKCSLQSVRHRFLILITLKRILTVRLAAMFSKKRFCLFFKTTSYGGSSTPIYEEITLKRLFYSAWGAFFLNKDRFFKKIFPLLVQRVQRRCFSRLAFKRLL